MPKPVKDVQGSTTIYYLRSTVLGGKVIAEITPSGSWSRGYVYAGEQLVAVQSGGNYFVHQDPISKSQRITNAAGVIVETIELDPFGGETNRSTNPTWHKQRYTTWERDWTGDESMFRRYHGWWSRFAHPDPYEGSYNPNDPQSFNRYAYVQNDPVNFIDPSGLDGEEFPIRWWRNPDGSISTWFSLGGVNNRGTDWIGWLMGGESGINWSLRPRLTDGEARGRINARNTGPQNTTPQKPKQDLQALFDKVRKDCLAREKANADRARTEYHNRYSSRLFWSMGTGALVGAVRGGYVGAVGGEFLEPLGGGVPGAIGGGVVGGILGAAGGVFTSVVKEPLYRAWYDRRTYNPAVNRSYLDCDAEARTAVATAQMGGRR